MADLLFPCNEGKFLSLYRNTVGQAFDEVMYIPVKMNRIPKLLKIYLQVIVFYNNNVHSFKP